MATPAASSQIYDQEVVAESAKTTPAPSTPIYDPDMPVYAEPEGVEHQDVAIEQKAVDEYIDPATATVEGRTAGLLTSGNPLLEKARADAMKTVNSRGLLNSTLAGQAGTAAVMDKAIQIASQDAALYGDMSKAQQNTDSQALLANQSDELATNLEKNRAKLTGALTEQEQVGQVELQKYIDSAQMQRIEVDNQWQQMIQWDTIDAEMQRSLIGVSQVFGESLTGGIERIMRDTNIKDKESAISSLMTQYKTQMTTAASIAGIDLTW